MKKLVTMQDLSSVGKCSLTVALPTISAMGVEVVPLVTSVLSSHTAFQNVYVRDLTDTLEGILDAWELEKFQFDGIYTAYLGSTAQVKIANRLLESFGNGHIKIVDPCMGDHGKLYRGFDLYFVEEMKNLCRQADILTPNLTEACFLLGIPYQEKFCLEELKKICQKLSALGVEKVILTGASLKENRVGAFSYDGKKDIYAYYDTEQLSQNAHGTGDLFTSVLSGAILRGLTVENSMRLSCDFVYRCMKRSFTSDESSYGIQFEKELSFLWESLSSMC